MFEVGVLRRLGLFGPKEGEIIRDGVKLLNELFARYYECHKIEEDYVGGSYSAHGDRPEISIKY
jgi:hypothetical protein